MKTRPTGHSCVSLLREAISSSVDLDCKHRKILVWAKVTPITNGKTKARMQSSLLQKRCAQKVSFLSRRGLSIFIPLPKLRTNLRLISDSTELSSHMPNVDWHLSLLSRSRTTKSTGPSENGMHWRKMSHSVKVLMLKLIPHGVLLCSATPACVSTSLWIQCVKKQFWASKMASKPLKSISKAKKNSCTLLTTSYVPSEYSLWLWAFTCCSRQSSH